MSDGAAEEEFLSTLYHALRTQRRRQAIRLMHESESQKVSVRILAREITAVENEISYEHATGEPYRNVYNALSQTHLPTLAEANIIIYDSERQTVSQGSNLSLAALLVMINDPTVETFREE